MYNYLGLLLGVILGYGVQLFDYRKFWAWSIGRRQSAGRLLGCGGVLRRQIGLAAMAQSILVGDHVRLLSKTD